MQFCLHCNWKQTLRISQISFVSFHSWHYLQAHHLELLYGLCDAIFSLWETYVLLTFDESCAWPLQLCGWTLIGFESQVWPPSQHEENETLVNATPQHFLGEPIPIVQEAGWALGPIWTGVANIAPTGIRLASRPTNWAIIMWSALNYWPTTTKCSWFVHKWHFVLSVLWENPSAVCQNGDQIVLWSSVKCP